MKTEEYKMILKMTFFAFVFYGFHKLLFYLFLAKSLAAKFIYSIELLYLFFFITSVLICALLYHVNKKNINNTGFTFLLLTVTKMGVAFYFMQPILKIKAIHQPTEKINFFLIFILFLAIETIVAIRILNNKQ